MLRLFTTLNARFAHQRGRTLLSVVGIALGVALGFAVNVINRAALGEFTAAVRSAAGEADLEVRGGRSGFPEELYATIARLPGVALASPVLELDSGIAHSARSIRLVGLDALRAAQIQPALFLDAPERRFTLLQPGVIVLSAGAAAALRVEKGARLQLVAGLEPVEFEVAGVLPAASLRGSAGLIDIAAAQQRFGRIGMLNRIDVRAAPGVSLEELRARIAPLLPAGTHVTGVETLEEQGASLSRAYRVNLNALALVALFTGGFLVFSAQALEVARRRREHALLRVLGLERRGVARLVLVEAAAIGALGSGLGLALGYALATLAVRFVGADLGAGQFRGLLPELGFPLAPAAGFLLGGVCIALAGAVLPALDAARADPARALKAGDEQHLFAKAVPVWPGAVLCVAAAGLAQLPPLSGIPVFGYAAIACLLVGSILFMPGLAQQAFRLLPSGRNVPLLLANEQLRGSPGQAMVSLAAIVASFSLMVAMAIMVSSFRQSVDEWLNAVLPADLYFRTSHAGDTSWFEPALQDQVRAIPAVERVEFLRSGRLSLDPARPAVSLIARDMPLGAANTLPLVGSRYERRADDPPPVWVTEAVADLYGHAPGRQVALPIDGKQVRFVVAGIWRDYARQHGAVLIERGTYIALTGDRRANDGAVWLKPGAGAGEAMAALRALPGGSLLDVAEPGEIREVSLRIFDRSFAITYSLEAVAVLVGLFGLSSSLGAIALSRRREFGMLRHLGMTRREIGVMLAAEGGMLAMLGVLAGLAVGGLIGLVLMHVVNRQSFNWSMELHLPLALLGTLSALLVVLAALTAWFSGREATGLGPVRAVKEDW
ncbi:MAG: FtsX-like permease family protein [Betaproteobacteria bacterium]|nr:FtsX-like permease family protein [Betaproteobacteria bacterium]